MGISLKEVAISAIYSSPLRRALDTAQAIADSHQMTVQVEPNLRELEVGELEGVSISELGTNFSHFLVQWQGKRGSVKMPGGESLDELGDRVGLVIQRIIEKHKNEVVAVVSHFFTTVTAICRSLDLPMNHIERIRVQPSSISILDFEGGRPCLVLLSDTCHLRES